jgi:hypothetical protein
MNHETTTATISQAAAPYVPATGDQIMIQESTTGALLARWTNAFAKLEQIYPQDNCNQRVQALQDYPGYVRLYSQVGDLLRCWAAPEPVQIYQLRFSDEDADKFTRFKLEVSDQPGLYYIRTSPELGSLYLSRWGADGTGFKSTPDEFCRFRIWRQV